MTQDKHIKTAFGLMVAKGEGVEGLVRKVKGLRSIHQ